MIRFAQHFFKGSIQRVRYYGFLGNAAKAKALILIRNQVGCKFTPLKLSGPKCDHCGSSKFKLMFIEWLPAPLIKKQNSRPRGPPGAAAESALERPTYKDLAKNLFRQIGPYTMGDKSINA